MKDNKFLFGKEEDLSADRVANLLIPLMSAVYAKQQLAALQGQTLALSEAFRAVVGDIFALSTEIVQIDRHIKQQKPPANPEEIQ